MGEKNSTVKIYFKEEQSLGNSPVIWILGVTFLVVSGISIWGWYQQDTLEKPLGNYSGPHDPYALAVFLPLIAMMVVLFVVSRIRLITLINEKGIQFGFTMKTNQKFIAKVMFSSIRVNFLGRRTFKLGQNAVSRDEIQRYEIRKYKAFWEYGGWGYRKRSQSLFSKKRSGVAFTVSGKEGLQLYLTTGANILIGTREPEGVRRAMKKLMTEGGIANV